MADHRDWRGRTGRADRLGLARREVYEQLARATDLDAVHDLLARYGPAILDRGLPYLLIAARNRARSRHRQVVARREAPLDESLEAELAASPLWDPYRRIADHDELVRVSASLATMDDRDVLVIWRHAEGYSDEEIVREWDELGFTPSGPSIESIRKRRERTRERLRADLGPRLNP